MNLLTANASIAGTQSGDCLSNWDNNCIANSTDYFYCDNINTYDCMMMYRNWVPLVANSFNNISHAFKFSGSI